MCFVWTVMFYVKCWVWLPCSMINVQDGENWWRLSLFQCLSLTVWVLLCCFQGRLIVYSTSVERWRKKRLCFVRRVRLNSNHGLLLRLHGKSATSLPDLLYWPLTHPNPQIWVWRVMGTPCSVLLDFWMMMMGMKIWEFWNLDPLLFWGGRSFFLFEISGLLACYCLVFFFSRYFNQNQVLCITFQSHIRLLFWCDLHVMPRQKQFCCAHHGPDGSDSEIVVSLWQPLWDVHREIGCKVLWTFFSDSSCFSPSVYARFALVFVIFISFIKQEEKYINFQNTSSVY